MLEAREGFRLARRAPKERPRRSVPSQKSALGLLPGALRQEAAQLRCRGLGLTQLGCCWCRSSVMACAAACSGPFSVWPEPRFPMYLMRTVTSSPRPSHSYSVTSTPSRSILNIRFGFRSNCPRAAARDCSEPRGKSPGLNPECCGQALRFSCVINHLRAPDYSTVLRVTVCVSHSGKVPPFA